MYRKCSLTFHTSILFLQSVVHIPPRRGYFLFVIRKQGAHDPESNGLLHSPQSFTSEHVPHYVFSSFSPDFSQATSCFLCARFNVSYSLKSPWISGRYGCGTTARFGFHLVVQCSQLKWFKQLHRQLKYGIHSGYPSITCVCWRPLSSFTHQPCT